MQYRLMELYELPLGEMIFFFVNGVKIGRWKISVINCLGNVRGVINNDLRTI